MKLNSLTGFEWSGFVDSLQGETFGLLLMEEMRRQGYALGSEYYAEK